MPLLTRLRLGFDLFLLLVFFGALVISWGFAPAARNFPLAITFLGVLFGIGNLALDVYRYRTINSAVLVDTEPMVTLKPMPERAQPAPDEDAELGAHGISRAAYYLVWSLAFGAAIWVAGIFMAVAAFLIIFFLFEAGTGWRFAVMATVGAEVVLYGLGRFLTLRWPENLLSDFVSVL